MSRLSSFLPLIAKANEELGQQEIVETIDANLCVDDCGEEDQVDSEDDSSEGGADICEHEESKKLGPTDAAVRNKPQVVQMSFAMGDIDDTLAASLEGDGIPEAEATSSTEARYSAEIRSRSDSAISECEAGTAWAPDEEKRTQEVSRVQAECEQDCRKRSRLLVEEIVS